MAVAKPARAPLRVRELREARNISQAELAARLGVTPTAVLFWETGRNEPGAARLLQLAGVLECSVDELYRKEVG